MTLPDADGIRTVMTTAWDLGVRLEEILRDLTGEEKFLVLGYPPSGRSEIVIVVFKLVSGWVDYRKELKYDSIPEDHEEFLSRIAMQIIFSEP